MIKLCYYYCTNYLCQCHWLHCWPCTTHVR